MQRLQQLDAEQEKVSRNLSFCEECACYHPSQNPNNISHDGTINTIVLPACENRIRPFAQQQKPKALPPTETSENVVQTDFSRSSHLSIATHLINHEINKSKITNGRKYVKTEREIGIQSSDKKIVRQDLQSRFRGLKHCRSQEVLQLGKQSRQSLVNFQSPPKPDLVKDPKSSHVKKIQNRHSNVSCLNSLKPNRQPIAFTSKEKNVMPIKIQFCHPQRFLQTPTFHQQYQQQQNQVLKGLYYCSDLKDSAKSELYNKGFSHYQTPYFGSRSRQQSKGDMNSFEQTAHEHYVKQNERESSDCCCHLFAN